MYANKDSSNPLADWKQKASPSKSPKWLSLRYTNSLVPRPRFPTAADGLHHRCVERGSGEMPNKGRSRVINVTSSNTVQYDVAWC